MATDDDERAKAQSLLSVARIAFEGGDVLKSLHLCQQAYDLYPSSKISRKLEKIKAYVAATSPTGESVNTIKTDQTDESTSLTSNNSSKETTNRSGKCSASSNQSDDLVCRLRQLSFITDDSENNSAAVNETNSAAAQKIETPDPEHYIAQARHKFEKEDFKACLSMLKKAYAIDPSPRIKRKIERITERLNATADGDDRCRSERELVIIEDDFKLPRQLFDKLYGYQREGVKWLWSLHKSAPGGVLADDMGLGKTVQVISFICGLFLRKHKSTALIVMPVSVLITWQSELKRWAPNLPVYLFHDAARPARLRGLAKIQRSGGVVLTTYGMATSSYLDLSNDYIGNPTFLTSKPGQIDRHGATFNWTYIVLDEAHKIKNPSAKATKAINQIPADHRLLLTGTAVQNNLLELWSLYNCTHQGRLLGSQVTFKREYEKPITRAREKDSSRGERLHGQLMAQSLRKLIDPFFLRRTKNEVFQKTDEACERLDGRIIQPDAIDRRQLPNKNELVVWLYLSSIQEKFYRDFLQSEEVKNLLMQANKRSPLTALIILKKLCDHPRLLSYDQCRNLDMNITQPPDGVSHQEYLPSVDKLERESVKLAFLGQLMQYVLAERNVDGSSCKTLIFSQSIRLLNMAEKIILGLNSRPDNQEANRRHRTIRLDGRLTKVADRLDVIDRFSKDPSYTVMLLTTQVGGVGLTLTCANRVVILDPSWNPATDAQAVDRVYRIGQKSNVLVYRLITCSTVEEKIYRRQVFKDSVIRQTTGQTKADLDPYRYFSRQDLYELFQLDDDLHQCKTQRQLAELHKDSVKWSDVDIQPHLAFLFSDALQRLVFGLSFHDLMFNQVDGDDRPPSDQLNALYMTREAEANQDAYFRRRQLHAEQALACEASGLPNPNIQPPPMLHHQANTFNRPPPTITNPQLFHPSAADSKRPLYNQPGLGKMPSTNSLHKHQQSPVLTASTDSTTTNDGLTRPIPSSGITSLYSTTDKPSGGSQHSPIAILLSSDSDSDDDQSDDLTPTGSCSQPQSVLEISDDDDEDLEYESADDSYDDGDQESVDQSHCDDDYHKSGSTHLITDLKSAGERLETNQLATSLAEMSVSHCQTPSPTTTSQFKSPPVVYRTDFLKPIATPFELNFKHRSTPLPTPNRHGSSSGGTSRPDDPTNSDDRQSPIRHHEGGELMQLDMTDDQVQQSIMSCQSFRNFLSKSGLLDQRDHLLQSGTSRPPSADMVMESLLADSQNDDPNNRNNSNQMSVCLNETKSVSLDIIEPSFDE